MTAKTKNGMNKGNHTQNQLSVIVPSSLSVININVKNGKNPMMFL